MPVVALLGVRLPRNRVHRASPDFGGNRFRVALVLLRLEFFRDDRRNAVFEVETRD